MSTRAELKENILASKMDGLLQWVLVNRVTVLAAGGLILVGILVASVFVLRQSQEKGVNWARLSQAQALYDRQQYNQSREILSEITSKTPSTTVGIFSSYYLGLINRSEGKFDEAVSHFQNVLARAGSSPLKPLAQVALADTYEKQQKFQEAAAMHKQFMAENENHFLAARSQLALGRNLAESGDKAGSKEALSQLIDLYPNSRWAENARRILDKMETR